MGIGDLLRRGLAAGAAAGVAAAAVLFFLTERSVKAALAIEDARGAAETASMEATGTHVMAEEALVTHDQQVVFALLGLVVTGILLGLVFSVIFAAVQRRLPGQSVSIKALWLAAISFAVVPLFPMLAIAANPPAVGNPDTIYQRTSIYLGSLVLGVVLVFAAFSVNKALISKVDDAVRHALNVGFVIVAAGVLLVLLPNTPDAVQDPSLSVTLNASPETIWDFRTSVLFQWATMWLVMASVFSILLTRKTKSVATEFAAA